MSEAERRIDVHHHVLPPRYVASTPMPVRPPEVPQQLETMDGLGISVAVTSLTPRVLDAHPDQLVSVARVCNEFQARLVADYPQRFGAFAVLPLPDVTASLTEIAHALDELRLDGVGLFSSCQGQYLGDRRLDPVFEELERRRAIVFVHPSHCLAPDDWNLQIPVGAIEYCFDTTRAIVNMLYAGTFERCPNVRMIFSHGGGTLPYLLPRITITAGERIPGLVATVRSLYYDIASVMGAPALRSLQEVADPTHLLWGSDLPFVNADRVGRELEHWTAYDGFDTAGRAAVEHENGLKLFPRFALGAQV